MTRRTTRRRAKPGDTRTGENHSLSFRGGHLTKTSGKRCPRCAPSRPHVMRCPRELLRCGVQTRCLCALHRARRGFSRSIAQHARVFVGGHNPAFPRFSCGGSCRLFLCGPRNAVQMAGGNRGPASRPRTQSIEIESELTNTHLNLAETRRRPVEEPDARGAQRELPPSHQRRCSQGETKFQPRDPQSSKRDVPRHAEPSTDSPPLTPSRSSSGCASPS